MSITVDKNKKPVSCQHYFGVPLFTKKLAGFSKYQQPLIDCILEEMSRSPGGINRSNRSGWHSEKNVHHWKNASTRWLVNQIADFAKDCFADSLGNGQEQCVTLKTSWANVNGPGAWNSPHGHFSATWSGVVFIAAEGANDKTTRSGYLELLNPVQLGPLSNPASSVTIQPQDGLMVLFPGYVLHWVHPNRTQHNRISIAFNLSVIPKSLAPTSTPIQPIQLWAADSSSEPKKSK